ncbi:MAG: carboxypeptidase regulatory-like domain-containing protein, partial [Acidobacteria bacterium]|nr:carboxypeptidase regulatory-like domain-containing protein [Acidobacteriota bacterium]
MRGGSDMLENRRSIVLAGMLAGACAVLLAVSGAPAAAQSPAPTPLAGAVTSPSGEALAGVAVSARAEGASITTSVFTDEGGRYYFPALEPPLEGGPYRVWAQAVGYERANADVVLDPARRVAQDFTLAAAADFTHQLSGVEWLNALPAATREDRRMKEVFRVTCTECHQAGLVLQNR